MKKRYQRIWTELRFYFVLLLGLILIPMLAGWVGDIAKDYFSGVPVGLADRWLFGIGLGGLLIFALLIGITGRRLIPARVVEQVEEVSPRKVVVAMLSPCRVLSEESGGGLSEWFIDSGSNKTDITNYSLTQIIDRDLRLPGFTWQQTLRAAEHHGDTLEKLVLLGSLGKGGSGTDEQLDLASRFFEHYAPGKVVLLGKSSKRGGHYSDMWKADFEKMDDVARLLNRARKELKKDGYQDIDTIIDVTGGQKTASIAAAMVTLDRPDLMFQYVGTGEHTGKVFGFNVETAPSGTGS